MASDTIICTSKRPLDPTLLNLEEDEATFFKLLTGIQDEEELKKHIIHVQEKAYQARFNQSRALGAAFLNHQVEQLEKSVSANSPSSGNWRDRKNIPTIQDTSPPQYHKRTPMAPGIKIVHRKNGSDTTTFVVQEKSALRERFNSKFAATENSSLIRQRGDSGDNDADIIIVDASVLVHALYQLKKWSRDGRKEIIIVPLEGILGVHIIFGLLLTQPVSFEYARSAQEGYKPSGSACSCSFPCS